MYSNYVVYWLFLAIGLAILIYEAHQQFDTLASNESDHDATDLFSSLKPGDMRSRSAFRSAELCYVGVIVIVYLLLCLSEAVQFVATTIIDFVGVPSTVAGGQAPVLPNVESLRGTVSSTGNSDFRVLDDPTIPFITAVTMVTAMRFPLVRKLENILRSFTHSLFGIPSIPKKLSAQIENTDIELSAIERELNQHAPAIPVSEQIDSYVEAYRLADPAGAEFGMFKRHLRILAAYRLWVQTGVWPTEDFRVRFGDFFALNRELIEKIDALFDDCKYLQSSPHVQVKQLVDEQVRLRRELWVAKVKSASRYAKTASSMFALFEQNSNAPAEGLQGSTGVRRFLSAVRNRDVERATQTNLTLLLILTGIAVNAVFGALQAVRFRMIGPENGFTEVLMNNSPTFDPVTSAMDFAIGALITFGVSLWVAVAIRRNAIATNKWRFHHDPQHQVPQIAQAANLIVKLFLIVFAFQLMWLLSKLQGWSVVDIRDAFWWGSLIAQAKTAALLAIVASLHGVIVVSIMDLARFKSTRYKWLKLTGIYIITMALVGLLIGYLIPGTDTGRSVRMVIYSLDQATVAAITGLWLYFYLRDRKSLIERSKIPTHMVVT